MYDPKMRGDKVVTEEGHVEAARHIGELLSPMWNLIVFYEISHTTYG
jgi:hypothetical protein